MRWPSMLLHYCSREKETMRLAEEEEEAAPTDIALLILDPERRRGAPRQRSVRARAKSLATRDRASLVSVAVTGRFPYVRARVCVCVHDCIFASNLSIITMLISIAPL